MNRAAIQTLARAVIETQAEAVLALLGRVDDEFLNARLVVWLKATSVDKFDVKDLFEIV